MIEYIKFKCVQFWNIISGKDKNWDGTVDIKDKMIEAENKSTSKQPPLPDRNPLALNVATLCLLLVGMMLLFVQPLIGIVFLGGVLALRWVN